VEFRELWDIDDAISSRNNTERDLSASVTSLLSDMQSNEGGRQ